MYRAYIRKHFIHWKKNWMLLHTMAPVHAHKMCVVKLRNVKIFFIFRARTASYMYSTHMHFLKSFIINVCLVVVVVGPLSQRILRVRTYMRVKNRINARQKWCCTATKLSKNAFIAWAIIFFLCVYGMLYRHVKIRQKKINIWKSGSWRYAELGGWFLISYGTMREIRMDGSRDPLFFLYVVRVICGKCVCASSYMRFMHIRTWYMLMVLRSFMHLCI